MIRLLGYTLFGIILVAYITHSYGATIATMPNEGGGKIVLTDEVCKHSGTTYSKLNRAYNYTTSGHGSEGCYFVEDETVVVIWDTPSGVRRMRYPIENFDVPKQRRGKSYGT
jgi:hypothetical protein